MIQGKLQLWAFSCYYNLIVKAVALDRLCILKMYAVAHLYQGLSLDSPVPRLLLD